MVVCIILCSEICIISKQGPSYNILAIYKSSLFLNNNFFLQIIKNFNMLNAIIVKYFCDLSNLIIIVCEYSLALSNRHVLIFQFFSSKEKC